MYFNIYNYKYHYSDIYLTNFPHMTLPIHFHANILIKYFICVYMQYRDLISAIYYFFGFLLFIFSTFLNIKNKMCAILSHQIILECLRYLFNIIYTTDDCLYSVRYWNCYVDTKYAIFYYVYIRTVHFCNYERDLDGKVCL